MTKTQRRLSVMLAGLTVLSACGESEKQLAAAEHYSCTQLAREIGKREQRRDSAQIDGFMNGLVSAVADDKKRRREADIESLANNIDEADAEKSLEQLTAIYRRKGCI